MGGGSGGGGGNGWEGGRRYDGENGPVEELSKVSPPQRSASQQSLCRRYPRRGSSFKDQWAVTAPVYTIRKFRHVRWATLPRAIYRYGRWAWQLKKGPAEGGNDAMLEADNAACSCKYPGSEPF